jgi:hypothetical protein
MADGDSTSRITGGHIKHDRICLMCGCRFLARRRANYCSIQCAWDKRRSLRPVVVVSHHGHCGVCSRHFSKDVSTQVYCSDGCRAICHRTTHEPRSCARCGMQFTPLHSWGRPSRYCGAECRTAAYVDNTKRGKRVGKARRRARVRGVASDAIDPIRVFERDGWRCHLCGRKTSARRRGTHHPLAPELDHVVTLADGGSHTWSNVACSCRRCNGAKGARSLGQIGLPLPV